MLIKPLMVVLLLIGTNYLSHKSIAQLAVGVEVDFTSDGAWCWFQDPRSVYIVGQKERIYAQWITNEGQLQVGAYNMQSGDIEIQTIKENWDVDDHNVGAFLVMDDKRLMIFYARHNKRGIFCRTSKYPEDISKWGEEIMISDEDRITYTHPVYLSAEGKYYVFWRGPSWKPTFATSLDGRTWSASKILIQDDGKEGREVRPYTKVTSDGVSSIHIAFTDGHPNREPVNSIYYIKYTEGKFTKADGSLVGGVESLPIQHAASDIVYNAKPSASRAWVWDIQLDIQGQPVVAYALFPEETKHHYALSRWNGQEWTQTTLTSAGGWFPQTPEGVNERETYYSGGISIDPTNTSTIYLSKQVDGEFEIEQWKTGDHGATWSSNSITSNSSFRNVRPVVPRGLPEGMQVVLWMVGNYEHYTRYNTGIRFTILAK